MKYALLAFFSLLFISNAFAQITTEIDEFTGEKSITSDAFNFEVEDGDVTMVTGSITYDEPNYLLIIGIISDEWQHLSDDEMYFLIDGERKKYKVIYKDSEMQENRSSYHLLEINGLMMTPSEFESIRNAKEVRFKFGTNIYRFSNMAFQYVDMMYNETNQ